MATSLLASGYPPCSRGPTHTASLSLSAHPWHIPTHRALILLMCRGSPLTHDSCHPSGSLINVMQSVRVPGSSKHPAPSAQLPPPHPGLAASRSAARVLIVRLFPVCCLCLPKKTSVLCGWGLAGFTVCLPQASSSAYLSRHEMNLGSINKIKFYHLDH